MSVIVRHIVEGIISLLKEGSVNDKGTAGDQEAPRETDSIRRKID